MGRLYRFGRALWAAIHPVKAPNRQSENEPIWCPVATMRAGRIVRLDDPEIRRGTQHFAPGARLYVSRIMTYRTRHGKETQDVEVVGRHRATHRYVRMIVRASWLERWRVDLVYSPTVISLLAPWWDGTAKSRALAEKYVAIFTARDAPRDA